MKPFDLKLAKDGHPVCTRKGDEVRILCFDRKHDDYPIVALVKQNADNEFIDEFTDEGHYHVGNTVSELDLFMASVKREGWFNLYRKDGIYQLKEMFDTKDNAIKYRDEDGYVDTVKIEWEE